MNYLLKSCAISMELPYYRSSTIHDMEPPKYDFNSFDISEKLSQHKVSRLSENVYADSTNIEINILNKSEEYHPGDLIQGFVLISNTSSFNIPFESFTLTLEGQFKKLGPRKVKTFLQMFSTQECFELNNMKSGHTYRQKFSFEIPSRLLDNGCSKALESHAALPSSLGENLDFCPIGLSLNYGIWGRFVGRRYMYDDGMSDELIVLKESANFVKFVLGAKIPSNESCKQQYDEFTLGIHSVIQEAMNTRRVIKSQLSVFTDKEKSSIVKNTSQHNELWHEKSPAYFHSVPINYQFSYPLYKKCYKTKINNTLYLKTPRQPYSLDSKNIKNSKLTIPLEISSIFPIGIKSISTDLVILTYEAINNAIPIEFHHDLLFNKMGPVKKDLVNDYDSFHNNLVIPLMKLNNELYGVSVVAKENDPDWTIDEAFIRDIKGLCDINVHTTHLSMPDTKQDFNQKSFSVECDLASLKRKGAKKREQFEFIPSFQACYVGRLYYIKVSIALDNGQKVFAKLAVNIS